MEPCFPTNWHFIKFSPTVVIKSTVSDVSLARRTKFLFHATSECLFYLFMKFPVPSVTASLLNPHCVNYLVKRLCYAPLSSYLSILRIFLHTSLLFNPPVYLNFQNAFVGDHFIAFVCDRNFL